MTSIEEADFWIGRTAIDDTGEQIGMISQIWVDDASGQPAWASVTGGALGMREALVSLSGTVPLGGGVQFAYSKAQILAAPRAGADGRLDEEETERLCDHYGTTAADAGAPARAASWMDRMEGSITRDPSSGTAPAGAGTAPAPAPAPEKARRLRRKPAGPEKKAGRRFGRKSASSDQARPASMEPMEPDEVPVGR